VIVDNSSAPRHRRAWRGTRSTLGSPFHFTDECIVLISRGILQHPYPTVAPTHELPTRGALKKHLRAFLASWNANRRPSSGRRQRTRFVRDHRKMLAVSRGGALVAVCAWRSNFFRRVSRTMAHDQPRNSGVIVLLAPNPTVPHGRREYWRHGSFLSP